MPKRLGVAVAIIGFAMSVSPASAITVPATSNSAPTILDQLQSALAPTAFPAFGQQIAHALGLDAPLTYVTPAIPEAPRPTPHQHSQRLLTIRAAPTHAAATSTLVASASTPLPDAALAVSQFVRSAQEAVSAIAGVVSALSADLAYLDFPAHLSRAAASTTPRLNPPPMAAAHTQRSASLAAAAASISTQPRTPNPSATSPAPIPTPSINHDQWSSASLNVFELQSALAELTTGVRSLTALLAAQPPSAKIESQIAALQSAISSQTYSAAASPPLGGGAPNTIAAAGAINQLSGTAITNPSITGGSISNTSISGGPVAANSLSVSGNTSLSGDLNVGGNFTAGTISFSAASSTGSITANSTTTNLIATNATSTDLFSTLADFGTAIVNTLDASVANIVGFTATNATTTNLVITSIPSGVLSTNANGSVQSTTISSPLSFSGNTLSIPQANASTNGFLASSDWTNFNNKVSSTSLSASYPLAYNSGTGVFSLGFGTTTTNTWSALQTFNAGYIDNASSTHTAQTNLTTASSTVFSVSGEGFFGTASTTNLTIGTPSALLSTNVSGVVSSTAFSGPLSFSSGTLSIPQANASTNGFLASSDWTNFNNKLGSSTVSTLTSNAIPKWTGTAFANSLVTDTGTAVGIGTTSPRALFSVSGGDTYLQETTDSPTALVVENAEGTSTLQVSTLNTSSNIFEVATSTGTAFFDITSAGNIGISSTSPATTFSVAGNGYLTGGLGVGVENTTAGTLQTSGAATIGGVLTVTGNTTLANATSTNLFSTTASSTNLFAQTASLGSLSLGNVLTVPNGGTGTNTFTTNGVLFGNGAGALQVTAAAANSILTTNGSNIPLFSTTLPAFTFGGPVTGNNQTLLGLNNFSAFASSTIGNGLQAGGLTISGGATTTGNAYFAGNITTNTSSNITIGNGEIVTNTGTVNIGNSYADTLILSGGTYATINAEGALFFQNNGTTAMNITGTGNVGIGTTTPTYLLSGNCSRPVSA
jgi:hypothetical protein